VHSLRRLASLVVVGSTLGGCLDLSLPDLAADGGVGPTLTIHTPQPGATIPLDAPVSLEAASVNGVTSVTVTCGGAPSTGVFSWSVPPYNGVLDFTRCTLVATGIADGGVGQLQLTFIGVDTLGHTSSKSFQVFLDTTTANLTVAVPARVVPGSPLQLTVASDRPLQLPPTVKLASREADGIVTRGNPDGGPPFYDVTFAQTPGLGIDNYTGDPFNVPFEVLSDIERSVTLTIDARATNGNATHLEQNVLLSRVAWDRAVPGRIALAPAVPVATAVGVHVALAATDPNPGTDGGVEWLPGLFRTADGTYVPFTPANIRILNAARAPPLAGTGVSPQLCVATPTTLAPTGAPPLPTCDGGVNLDDAGTTSPDGGTTIDPDAGQPFPDDAGYLAMDFDARGHTVFGRSSQTGTDVLAVGEPGPTSPVMPAANYALPFPLSKPLSRVDDLLCLPDLFTGNNDGCWFAPATQNLLCFAPGTASISLTTASSPTQDLGQPNAGETAGAHGAPRTYLSPNDVPNCGPAWAFLAPSNFFNLQSRFGTPFGGCVAESVTRLLTIPDGSFAIAETLECGTVSSIPGYVVVRVGSQGTVTGTYFAKQDVVLPTPPPTVLAALSDGRVVTMRNEPPFTTFEAWPPDGSPPTATARVPGLYVFGGGGRLASDLNAANDGSLTVLLNSATLGDVVLHFGPGLQPRWLYRYPRIVNNSSLVAGDDQGTVYYVDPLNNDIVALRRF
jgi:hypothetical protein